MTVPLNEQKFQHNFKDTIDPMCNCGLEPEIILNYILHCNLYPTLRVELLNAIWTYAPSLRSYFNSNLYRRSFISIRRILC